MSNLHKFELPKPRWVGASHEDIEATKQAYPCIKWLIANNFEVKYTKKGTNRPRVFIRTSPLCQELNGAVHRFERINGEEKRYWFAIRLDCEVRWDDEVKS